MGEPRQFFLLEVLWKPAGRSLVAFDSEQDRTEYLDKVKTFYRFQSFRSIEVQEIPAAELAGVK